MEPIELFYFISLFSPLSLHRNSSDFYQSHSLWNSFYCCFFEILHFDDFILYSLLGVAELTYLLHIFLVYSQSSIYLYKLFFLLHKINLMLILVFISLCCLIFNIFDSDDVFTK